MGLAQTRTQILLVVVVVHDHGLNPNPNWLQAASRGIAAHGHGPGCIRARCWDRGLWASCCKGTIRTKVKPFIHILGVGVVTVSNVSGVHKVSG